MRKNSFYIISPAIASFFLFIVIITGCKNSPTGPYPLNSTSSDEMILQKIADADSAVATFEPNYNEEDVMSVMGKVQANIYPFRVWQRVRLVSRDFNVNIVGDSAFATYTRNFEGVLFIVASYDSTSSHPDTLIRKPFLSTITGKLIFHKRINVHDSTGGWRLTAVSLPEGGTAVSHIKIKKITVFYSNGDSLVVASPGNYFLSRGKGGRGRWKGIPRIHRNRSITVKLELTGAYADTDFVTLTHGGNMHGINRSKAKFNLVSSTPEGNGYYKVYQLTFGTHRWGGFSFAVINVFPHQVIYDDSVAVESNTWGIPYFVHY